MVYTQFLFCLNPRITKANNISNEALANCIVYVLMSSTNFKMSLLQKLSTNKFSIQKHSCKLALLIHSKWSQACKRDFWKPKLDHIGFDQKTMDQGMLSWYRDPYWCHLCTSWYTWYKGRFYILSVGMPSIPDTSTEPVHYSMVYTTQFKMV